jgi:hypothetical protein
LFLTFALASVSATEVTFKSGPARVSLVELYTSEGCSSCPPAEKWLGELRNEAGLWERFVPVAFHVNYWDRLGWRDVFATKEFTQRQYAHAEAWRAASVYTPCFVRDGQEWHPRAGDAVSAATPENAGTLEISRQSDGSCEVVFSPASITERNAAAFDVTIALLGAGIVSPVRAGENAGRELRHDFLALQLVSAPLVRANATTWSARLVVRETTVDKRPAIARRALAAWVAPHGRLAPTQAVGGWLP